jgi:4-amino-4-deoxy-L-arabinose transferase-like glycosyltransferase
MSARESLVALLRKVPAAAWACAGAGVCAALAWSLLVPPFHVPDEPAHVAYINYLARSGRLPTDTAKRRAYSPEQKAVLEALGFTHRVRSADDLPPRTRAEERALRAAEDAGLSPRGPGGAQSATNNPPLYYALEVPLYWAAPSGRLLDRVVLMRLLSVLLMGATVLAAFMLARELLPSTPWTWPVAALVVAFQPLLGDISGGVNPDALLFALASALLLAVARILKRGLTARRGVALGALLAAGVLTKPLFWGLVPGALLALVLAGRSAHRATGRVPVRPVALALLTALVPMLIYTVLGPVVWDHGLFGVNGSLSGTIANPDVPGVPSLRFEFSYLWQLFLPRLPTMHDYFNGVPIWDLWIQGFIGRFGWLEYGFDITVYRVVAWVLVAVLGLAVAELVRRRARTRAAAGVIACYLTMLLGLALVIGLSDWHAFLQGAPRFQQARYFLPLVGIYGLLAALGTRVFGRRAGPYAGLALVTAAFAHYLAALVLAVNRYYG